MPTAVVLVEPPQFGYNAVTAEDNAFQHKPDPAMLALHNKQAKDELSVLHSMLVGAGIRTLQFSWLNESVALTPGGGGSGSDDAPKLNVPPMPDSIFPNNSISFHEVSVLPESKCSAATGRDDEGEGTQGRERDGERAKRLVAIMYPMSPGRRNEVPPSLLARLQPQPQPHHSATSTLPLPPLLYDMRAPFEASEQYLEGTGAINFSPDGRAAFVSLSLRAHIKPLVHLLTQSPLAGHVKQLFLFSSAIDGVPVYHTNVVGWNGTHIAAYCLEAIEFGSAAEELLKADGGELQCEVYTSKESFLEYFASSGVELMDLSIDEVKSFAGNAKEHCTPSNNNKRRILTLSSTAWEGLTAVHKEELVRHYGRPVLSSAAAGGDATQADTRNNAEDAGILVIDIPVIEQLGGGSVRCLQATLEYTSEAMLAELIHPLSAP